MLAALQGSGAKLPSPRTVVAVREPGCLKLGARHLISGLKPAETVEPRTALP